ncbi:L,D-transpeptidase family protein [Clostridium sp. MB40-C1]|uniref:L,D-transpeptidase family protein n=1 Tax=Clostridium sp. MB40-C1 TaxID=3070996 RepID=UPI0027E04D63|nr:L,D-transpeptidase family protein [Clostridium sp. MB40-C1]WMJ79992.1 L,D-transpeptidase family protein [Clostridium sp. MB40-C1]
MRRNCFKSIVAMFLIAVFSFMINGSTKAYGAEAIPRIQKIVLEYENVREGDIQTINVASRFTGKVQYRVWLASKKTGVWQDITNGFTSSMNYNEVLSINTPALKEGDYTVSVWVKRAGVKAVDKRGFDTYSTIPIKCLKNDGQTPNIKLNNIKHTYSKGQLLEVKKQEGKNYFYKYSLYNVLKNKTVVSYESNYTEGFSWKATEDGMYLLKLKLRNIEKIAIPKIKKIVLKDEKVFEGCTQTIDVQANFPGEIQYKIWLCNRQTGVWQDITNGFTKPITQEKAFSIVTPKLQEGNYTISVWAKRAGEKPIDKRGFDTYSVISMNCFKNDGKVESDSKEVSSLNNKVAKEEVNKQSEEVIQESKDIESNKDSVNIEDTSNQSLLNNGKDTSNISDDKENSQKISKNNEGASKEEESQNKNDISNIKDIAKEQNINNTNDKEEPKEDSTEVEYKEIITEEEITKIIIVGNPYTQPVVPPKDNSIYVANVSETSKLYVRSQPNTSSSIVGYIYGSLQSINVIKRVGAYSYIEATDYGTLTKVKGYVPSSYIKSVQPRKDYSIIVDLSDQYVYIYKDGKLLKKVICSTGQNATPTPTGTYIIGSRGSYFLTGYKNSVKCYNWVRFNYNFLFHSVLCTKSGQPLQSAVSQLGHKASHGCIRLPLNDSKWFYNTIPAGTLVTIRP